MHRITWTWIKDKSINQSIYLWINLLINLLIDYLLLIVWYVQVVILLIILFEKFRVLFNFSFHLIKRIICCPIVYMLFWFNVLLIINYVLFAKRTNLSCCFRENWVRVFYWLIYYWSNLHYLYFGAEYFVDSGFEFYVTNKE